MRQENTNYLLVGILVLSMASLLMVVHLILSGESNETDRYFTVYQNVGGITDGSAVTYGGYKIGKVQSIGYEQANGETRFKLNLNVIKGWHIPQDSVARIASGGLLSDNVINIVEGKSKQRLEPGGVITGEEAVGIFDAINSVAYELQDLSANSIRPLIENVSNRFNSISTNLDDLSISMRDSIPVTINEADDLLRSLNNSAEKVSTILGSNNQNHINNLLENADSISQNLNNLSRGLDETISQIDEVLNSANLVIKSNEPDLRESVRDLRTALSTISKNIDSIVYNLDTTSRNANEFSRQIRDNPGAILGSNPPKERRVDK